MSLAIEVLRSKGHKITDKEATGVTIAILLHDIGHGPFSHALEKSLVYEIAHEDISIFFMERLNKQFKGKLELAIKIYKGQYKKKFLHQLVASQLDVDRLDYLKRDSFFSGVAEGVISADRIIKMFNIKNDQLVIDAKGIYSVEKFLIARRLMYWQVYLHKTVIVAEFLLIKILQRAKQLVNQGEKLFCTPALEFFLYNYLNKSSFKADNTALDTFSQLDDYDIFTSVKVWMHCEDSILATLCKKMVNRELFKIEIQNKAFSKQHINKLKKKAMGKYGVNSRNAHYFVFSDSIANSAYNPATDRINVLYKDGKLVDVAKASDQLNISVLSKTIKKHFLCYPKGLI